MGTTGFLIPKTMDIDIKIVTLDSDSDKFIRFSTSYKETTKQQQQKNAENQETST